MSSTSPTVDQLKRAVAIAEQIKSLEAEMAQILGQPVAPVAAKRGRPAKVPGAAAAAPAKKRKKLSPEGLAAIVAAQKARWAKQKKASAAPAVSDKGKK